jgi:glycosyltransferase involved in cell wall biosynthesis
MKPWLIVAGDFTPLGGMDRANHALAAAAADAGRDVHLVAHRIWPDLAGRANVRSHLVPRPAGSHMLGAPLLRRAAGACARTIAANGGRVVANGGNVDAGDAVWVHYVHAAYEPHVASTAIRSAAAKAARSWYLAMERRSLERARLVICNSRRTADDLQQRLAVPADKLRVVYYGVDGERFLGVTPARRQSARAAFAWNGRPVVLFVGALGDRRKGFDTLFDAWTTLSADAAWDAVLAVVGDGGERAAWEARAARRGLGDCVRFLGFRQDVAQVMAGSDVLVHPARYEAYGLGVHEALCTGIPAIVSAAAGVAEKYPASLDGLLLRDPESADEVAVRLRAWRTDLDGWANRAQAAGASLRARTWACMAREIESLLES